MNVDITDLAIPWDTEYLTEYLTFLEADLLNWHQCWESFMKWKPDPQEIRNQMEVKANLEHQIGQLKTILAARGIKCETKGEQNAGGLIQSI